MVESMAARLEIKFESNLAEGYDFKKMIDSSSFRRLSREIAVLNKMQDAKREEKNNVGN